MSIFLRWGLPALVTVIGGTAAAVTTSGAAIPTDLAARSGAVVSTPALGWAEVEFDMRDATLRGTASSQQQIDEAMAAVAAVHGVRSVNSSAVVAEYASPFPFTATVEGDRLVLTGGIPDERLRPELHRATSREVVDNLALMSGGPGSGWLDAATYAVDISNNFDQGSVALQDLELTVAGRAKSARAVDELSTIASGLPEAGKLASAEVTPPLLSPYEWRAEYDGGLLFVSGATPSEALTEALVGMAPDGVRTETALELASGAPDKFETTAKALVENLLKLKHGSASISGVTSSLSGQPVDASSAHEIELAMTSGGTSVTFSTPEIKDYWFSAEWRAGALVLDGYVPDETLRDRLEAMDAVDASGLELGRGGPVRFESGVDFIVELLGRMSEGQGEIHGTSLSIDGRAATVADYKALETALSLGAPQGLILTATSVRPPLAAPFTFEANRGDDGAISLSGHVPSEAARKAIRAAAGSAADSMVVADGNPADFEATVTRALGVLVLLDSGKVTFDGANWSLAGRVDSAQKAFAAEAAFADAGLKAAGWTYSVELPEAPKVAALPVVNPYAWQAEKSAKGTISFSGYVPTAPLQHYLLGHAGGGAVDDTKLAAGAPQDFIPAVLAGVDALMSLDEGTLSLSGGQWSLVGVVATTEARHQVEQVLQAAADISAWHVAIQSMDAAQVVTPFVWSASRPDDGTLVLGGYVPSAEVRDELAALAGTPVDNSLVGSGEPADFVVNAKAGLSALLALRNGEAAYDGTAWSLSGQPATAADAEVARAALADSEGPWTVALADPPASTEAAEAATDEESSATDAAAPTEEAGLATSDSVTVLPGPDTGAEVDVAEVETPAEVEAPAEVVPTVPLSYVFDGNKVLGGPITFAGAVPAEPMRRHLAVITGGQPNEALEIDAQLPGDFIANADAASRALVHLADGQFGLAGETWTFIGRAESDVELQAALKELSAVPAPDKWQTNLTLLPAIAVCREKVDLFAARNAIVFQSGSSRIAPESLPAVDELAADLAVCPDAIVSVEGHTDSDGDDEANLALSVQRAEAVVDALIERGIGPERLYAIGYGEALPIADNATRAGKQANRRIAFTISEE